MSHRYINQLEDGEQIDEVYIASEKQLRPNRNGNLYLQMRLSDKTGSLTAMLWNANQSHYNSFDNGDFVRIQGTSQVYNGGMQVLAKGVRKADSSHVNEDDYVTMSTAKLDAMVARIAEMLRSMTNVHLRNLAECFLVDEPFMAQFRSAPAGIKNHHAYRGGLLEHVVSLMELTTTVAPHYEYLDPEMLTLGAFLHDVGKIEELIYEPDLGYSDSGQLVGHLVQGVLILEEKIRETERLTGEPFPTELANQLRHMIVSHHGQYEFGSPKLPMTLEAIALHYLDTMDARLHSVRQLIEEDVNKDSAWTVYNPGLQRKFYKGAQ